MATGNVLAIQTLMATPTDQSLFVLPEISRRFRSRRRACIFSTSRRREVTTRSITWQPDLTFSVQHGFFSAPFQLTLTTTTPGATIYYTTDNSTPSATNGTAYTGPITISATTDVRAVSIIGGNAGVISTESYIFLADVINQPAAPPGFPTIWGEDDNGNPRAGQLCDESGDHSESALFGRAGARFAVASHRFDHDDVANMFSAVQSQTTNPGIYTNLKQSQSGRRDFVGGAGVVRVFQPRAVRSVCKPTWACRWKGALAAIRNISCTTSAWSFRRTSDRRR